MFRALVHLLGLMAVAGLASAQVYKWVDERGVTHYGEHPPPGAKAAEISKSPTPPAAAPASQDDYQEKEREFRRRRIRAEAEDAKRRQDAAQRRERCNRERDELAQMRVARRMYILNENGERTFMDDAARADAIARQERLVAQVCPG